MKFRCPKCNGLCRDLRGNYLISATSNLRFTREGASLRPAVAPLELISWSLSIDEVSCLLCNHTSSLETWTLIICCINCGRPIVERPASTNMSLVETYCHKEHIVICGRCAERSGYCIHCNRRDECLVINKEEEET